LIYIKQQYDFDGSWAVKSKSRGASGLIQKTRVARSHSFVGIPDARHLTPKPRHYPELKDLCGVRLASEPETKPMNKLILAAALTLSSVIAMPAASYADSVTIRTYDGPGMHRGWDRAHRGPHARMVREERRSHDCMTKKVTTMRHGERVTKVTKVCR